MENSRYSKIWAGKGQLGTKKARAIQRKGMVHNVLLGLVLVIVGVKLSL